MLKLSLKQGQYVNIGDDIRVVYVGGSGNHARLLIDAPRELNIARSTTEENPARRRETYYRSEDRRVEKECRSRWSPYH